MENINCLNEENKTTKESRKERIARLQKEFIQESSLAMEEIRIPNKKNIHTKNTISIAKELKELKIKLTDKAVLRVENCVLNLKNEDSLENLKLVTDFYVKNENYNRAIRFINIAMNENKKYKLDERIAKIKQEIQDLAYEQDIMLYIEQGKTTREIAERLGKRETEIIKKKNEYLEKQKNKYGSLDKKYSEQER